MSTYDSITQLANAMPSNSILSFNISANEREMSLYPVQWGEVFMQKIGGREKVIFTTQQISSDENFAYIKYVNYNNETNWSKIILDKDFSTMWRFNNDNAISIPENADLKSSTYLVLGVYKCDTSVRTSTLKNCPTHDAFILFVYKTLANHAKYVTQEIRTIDNQIFKRFYNGYEVENQAGPGWKNDVEIVTTPGLDINRAVVISSGYDVYFQVGTGNDYTRLTVNNKWVVIEHYTNGTKDKTIPLWDGTS